MSGLDKRAGRRSVRRSVVRRAVVGSLVVMLAPFLTVLESDADTSALHRSPIIYHSEPAEPSKADAGIQLLSGPLTDTDKVIASIGNDLRTAADGTWAY